MSGPRVSCIIPTFNSAQFLAAALESVRGQTYPHVELIVSDDGSSDGTEAIARGSGAAFVRGERAGPAANRNRGVEHSTGELLAFLDADDLWHPLKLELQIARLARNPGLGGVTTMIQPFENIRRTDEGWAPADEPARAAVPGFLTTTLVVRRAAFTRVGPLDPARWFSDSADWFLRARAMNVPIELVPEILTFHRVRPESLSRHRADESRREFLTLMRDKLRRER